MAHPNLSPGSQIDLKTGLPLDDGHGEPNRFSGQKSETPIGLSGLMERSVSGSKPFTAQEIKKGFRKLSNSKLSFRRKRGRE